MLPESLEKLVQGKEQQIHSQEQQNPLQEQNSHLFDDFLAGSFVSGFAVIGLPYFFPTYARTFVESRKKLEENAMTENPAFDFGVHAGTLYGLGYHALTSIGYYAAIVQEMYGPLLLPLATNALSAVYELGRRMVKRNNK